MSTNGWAGAVAQDRFSAEIRGAVNALLGLTDLLLDTPLDAMQREYVDVVRSTADRLLALGAEPVAAEKAEARPQWFVPIDAQEIIVQVSEIARALAPNPCMCVTAVLGEGLDKPLLGDRQYAEQALLSVVKVCTSTPLVENLLIRATLASDEEVVFAVHASSPREQSVLTDELEHRLLATGRHVDSVAIHEQRGRLVVSFRIPVKTPSETISSLVQEGPQFRVLLAEDAADNQFIVRAFLRSQPYELDVVGTGEEAVERVRTGSYALVLMDLEMPGMSGVEATSLIREWENVHNRPAMPIIALTAHAGASDVAECLSHGFSGFLAKPVGKAALLSALRSYCIPTQ